MFKENNKFKRVRHSLENETPTSRPVTGATTENAEAVKKLTKEEARMTVEQIQNILGMEPTATDLICKNTLMCLQATGKMEPTCSDR